MCNQGSGGQSQVERGKSIVSLEGSVDSVEDVPRIYMCATMWHETRQEIVQILKSIFR